MRSPFVLSLHLIVFLVGLVCLAICGWPVRGDWPWFPRVLAAGLFFVFLSQLITI